jgi:REP element-mobilizing transposase RayT
MLPHVWNLRSRRCFTAIAITLLRFRAREDFRIIHFSIQGNHIHLILEAIDENALARRLQGFGVWFARRLNSVMARRGKVFADRYYAHQLRSLAEARNAIRYVVGNFDEHARRRGETITESDPDPYSSAKTQEPALVSEAETWLLRAAVASG